MLEMLLDKSAQWLAGDGPEADIAVHCECHLVRNLIGYPYPGACTDEEKVAIEERILSALDGLNLLATGRYCPLTDLDRREARFLAERRLIGPELVEAQGARGVYIADDQSLSITINEDNHLTLRGLASGLQLPELWARVNLIDDTLAGVLDFAFDERRGYLTSALGDVGTGLKATATLHLPGIAMLNGIADLKALLMTKRHALQKVYGAEGDAAGDLYQIQNTSTLGRSEEETLFHIKHFASDIINQEREARKRIRTEAPFQLEDRAGRALGVARGARILAFEEGLEVLSSLRLGASIGLQSQFSLSQINEVQMAAHNAQIEMKCGQDCDELKLSTERADLFRSRFA